MESLRRLHVTKRPHQSLTPIRPELATVMLNLARLPRGSGSASASGGSSGSSGNSGRLLDPFCGSGSFLLLAAQHQLSLQQAVGCDVHLSEADAVSPAHGDDGAAIADNFAEFGLPTPDLIRANIFTPVFRQRRRYAAAAAASAGAEGIFDAIVTDPPYGTRERCHAEGQQQQQQQQGGGGGDGEMLINDGSLGYYIEDYTGQNLNTSSYTAFSSVVRLFVRIIGLCL